MAKVVDAVLSMENNNAIGLDKLPIESLKLSVNGDDEDTALLLNRFHDTAVVVWNGGGDIHATQIEGRRCNNTSAAQKGGSQRVR